MGVEEVEEHRGMQVTGENKITPSVMRSAVNLHYMLITSFTEIIANGRMPQGKSPNTQT